MLTWLQPPVRELKGAIGYPPRVPPEGTLFGSSFLLGSLLNRVLLFSKLSTPSSLSRSSQDLCSRKQSSRTAEQNFHVRFKNLNSLMNHNGQGVGCFLPSLMRGLDTHTHWHLAGYVGHNLLAICSMVPDTAIW